MIEQFIYKRLAWYNESKNLRIGGLVGAGINTPYKLATNLKVDVTDISSFTIKNDVIHCRMRRFRPNTQTVGFTDLVKQNLTFWIEDNKFYNEFYSFFIGCTALKDLQVKGTHFLGGYPKISYTQIERLEMPNVTYSYSNQSVIHNSKLKEIIMPQLTEIKGNNHDFGYNPNLEVFDAKKLRKINQVYNSNPLEHHFLNTGKMNGCVYKVHQDLLTSAPDGGLNLHLRWVWRNRGARIEFYDDNGGLVQSV